jgi:hypothetical protein
MNSVTIQKIKEDLEYIDPQERQTIKRNISTPLSIDDLIQLFGEHFRDDMILYSNLDQYKV